MSKDTIVFVVDDDPIIRQSLAGAFKEAGVGCITFRSAEDFLAELEPDQAGCLILDLHMPGRCGVDLLRELRQRPDFSMPVIAITGNGDVRETVESMKLGVAEFLLKPLDCDDLVTVVQRLLIADASRRFKDGKLALIRRRIQRLSPREGEIVPLICAGQSNKGIGAKLNLSTKTIANHRASIIAKLEAINTADLVRQVVVATLQ